MSQTATAGLTLALIGETFTGDLSTASTVAVPTTQRMHVLAWSLTVTGNTAACPVQIKTSGGVVYAASRAEAHGTLAATGYGAQPTHVWTNAPGMQLPPFPAGEELVIGGGATSGVVDGTVTYILRDV